MLGFLNITYLSQHFAINKSPQYPTNLNQNHIPAATPFIFFKFFKNINSIFQILTAFLSKYLADKYFIFPGSIGTCIFPLPELVLL